MTNTKPSFNYNSIPLGYYDHISNNKKGMRSFWHHSKFKRVIDSIDEDTNSILDIGCFAGTFLGMIPESHVREQVGIDILEEQINFANIKYGTNFRKFYAIKGFNDNTTVPDNYFDLITCIEVMEHLTSQNILELFAYAHNKLKPGGKFIITTPNYASVWPLLEVLLDKYSDVKYEEQHISKFNYYNVFGKLGIIVPDFSEKFQQVYKTTTHLATPFIAGISFNLADWASTVFSASKWKIPIGALLLFQLQKK
jgi:2-polyprenyl-3-methyl-5-hydroxy-6-metoxy-1,4-benzoquinol methylase